MKFPVGDDTLAAWSKLLGLDTAQTAKVLEDIEQILRRGYTIRPLHIRHLTFEQATADMSVDEFALMFLTSGLRRAGHPELAAQVLSRGLAIAAGNDPTN